MKKPLWLKLRTLGKATIVVGIILSPFAGFLTLWRMVTSWLLPLNDNGFKIFQQTIQDGFYIWNIIISIAVFLLVIFVSVIIGNLLFGLADLLTPQETSQQYENRITNTDQGLQTNVSNKWTCPNCNTVNARIFTRCWNCNYKRIK